MKPKDWLVANGHIKEAGRGRLSLEHKALIEQAVRDGAQIDGFAVSTAVPKTDEERRTPKVEKIATSGTVVYDVPDIRRHEDDWEAYVFQGGKEISVGMRTVCNTCKNSLTYCPCVTPLVTFGQNTTTMVVLKPRKTPLPKKKW